MQSRDFQVGDLVFFQGKKGVVDYIKDDFVCVGLQGKNRCLNLSYLDDEPKEGQLILLRRADPIDPNSTEIAAQSRDFKVGDRVLFRGKQGQVISMQDDWVGVNLEGEVGYVDLSFLDDKPKESQIKLMHRPLINSPKDQELLQPEPQQTEQTETQPKGLTSEDAQMLIFEQRKLRQSIEKLTQAIYLLLGKSEK